MSRSASASAPENIVIFGLTAEEVAERRAGGYDPRAVIEGSPELSQALSAIASGVFSPDDPGRYRELIDGLYDHDWFMVAADFDAYAAAQREVDELWSDPSAWWREGDPATPRGWAGSPRTAPSANMRKTSGASACSLGADETDAGESAGDQGAREAGRRARRRSALDPAEIEAIVAGAHGDPVRASSACRRPGGELVARAFIDGAESSRPSPSTASPLGTLERRHDAGFFEGPLDDPQAPAAQLPRPQRRRRMVGDRPLFLRPGARADGRLLHRARARTSGCSTSSARIRSHHEGADGVHFAVWAPNARRVSVVGDFNDWDGRRHSMRLRRDTGIWEIFIPDVGAGPRLQVRDHRPRRRRGCR